ncbi:class I SAM-dependent methyltransferase [Thermococcus sp. LS1]|uniref:class I SAM-dependent methyltransferase n=1 Tax=Thermococcus sp. LS1 TaxID=1638259 RepID=UPI00143AA608|nr:class I SAM-dependent methyltransferase [Thermococcus sp. LS1]NJD99112.1 class I SAM-dependent methyltransferase [Thermococcus sp. LS1]
MSLKEFYRHFRWWMEPKDVRAVQRFHSIVRFFEGQEVNASSVLDLCAGTGIAGVAVAKALSASKLTLVEARDEDLKRVTEWLEIASINPELNLIAGDVLTLPTLVDKHDVAVLWGHTMPHFDPFEVVRLFAGVAVVLSEDGTFFIEETDRISRFLYHSNYKNFLVEAKTEEYTLVSLHEGYDVRRGIEKRGYYRLPGFEKVTEMELRAWDLASQLALGKIFFKDAELITPPEHGVSGVSEVLVFRRPRRKIAREIYSEFQNSW